MHGNGTHGMDGWDWAWMTPMMLLWVALIALAVYVGIRLASGAPGIVRAADEPTPSPHERGGLVKAVTTEGGFVVLAIVAATAVLLALACW